MYHPYPANYHPYTAGYRAAPGAPDVPLAVFKAANEIHATHLSNDGKRAYTNRYGLRRVHFWDGLEFGSGFPYGDTLPDDAVEI